MKVGDKIMSKSHEGNFHKSLFNNFLVFILWFNIYWTWHAREITVVRLLEDLPRLFVRLPTDFSGLALSDCYLVSLYDLSKPCTISDLKRHQESSRIKRFSSIIASRLLSIMLFWWSLLQLYRLLWKSNEKYEIWICHLGLWS